MNFGCLGCRRAGDIALPSFLASMNSVGEFVETMLSRINIAETNELVESWRGASGVAGLPDDLNRQRTFLLRKIGKIYWVRRIRCLEPDYWPQRRRSGAWLNDLLVSSLVTLLDSESLRARAHWPLCLATDGRFFVAGIFIPVGNHYFQALVSTLQFVAQVCDRLWLFYATDRAFGYITYMSP